MNKNSSTLIQKKWRKSTQPLAPPTISSNQKGQYDIYPAFDIGSGKINRGFDNLAEKIKDKKRVIIDGYIGVFWDSFIKNLNASLEDMNLKCEWMDVTQAMKSSDEIKSFIDPYLGGDDPIFGTRYTGELRDYFINDKLNNLQPSDSSYDITILYGSGAFLSEWDAEYLYVDLPKNEIQFRSRAQTIRNLGAESPTDPKNMYKRFYFVDWIVLNKHKETYLPEIDWIVDEQRPGDPATMSGDSFRESLYDMSRNCFRARPWFEPGTWGGKWIQKNIPQVPKEPVNIAWSFELITPENGLIFTSDEYLLETSFDWLMYQEHDAILGDSADVFGYEFPIRFDFLDTIGGGNLSVQCHPSPEFIKKEFGETFTQDETYYMLDCEPGSKVYLGFQDGVKRSEFRSDLEESAQNNSPVEIDDYVQSFEADKHDLFLIPHETIHCSGSDNMVLEISATPYIFTFKMYDWLRTDLDGNPRPINIDRAFKNLNFDYQGDRVPEELISEPQVLEEGDGWKLENLPTHEKHFYSIHRYEFENEIEVVTDGSCNVLSLVEGASIMVETKQGRTMRFNYAETFVIPAAAESYRLINEGKDPAKVVKAFVKADVTLQ